jgi:hypothetical protein
MPFDLTRRDPLRIHALAVAGIGLLLTLVWATTADGFFWPIQAILPLALTVAVHAWLRLLAGSRRSRERFLGSGALAAHAGVAAAMWLYLVSLWAIGGLGYFWPAWALLGLMASVGIHALRVASAHPEPRLRSATGADPGNSPGGAPTHRSMNSG